jgi:hypothetical protein
MYFAAAWPAGISLVLSMASLFPSLMNPSLIGVPVAGFAGPSSELLAALLLELLLLELLLLELLAVDPDDDFELLHAVTISAEHASTPSAPRRIAFALPM